MHAASSGLVTALGSTSYSSPNGLALDSLSGMDGTGGRHHDGGERLAERVGASVRAWAPTHSSASATDPLLQSLNDKQLEAVTAPDESVIILAGAGSGKTKVLTTRIAWLLEQGRTTHDQILAVTFTNKAAKEMKTRLGKMVDVPVRDMWIGTFHGLCHRMLRENARLAGLPGSFVIMDQDDQLGMVKRILKEEGGTLPEDVTPQKLQQYINRRKEEGLRAGHCLGDDDLDGYAAPFYSSYEARCAKEGVVDFTELMLRVSELMRSNRDFRETYQDRFSHIHVDEFQDTNEMQYEWLKTLKGDRGVVFAVGDDDQSIYSFRGSKPENMMDFMDTEASGRVVRLEQNYRSTNSILGAANALIEKNSDRMGKNLWTDAGEGDLLKLMNFSDDRDEANHVASMIKARIRKGVSPSEIAILYRSNWQSRSFENALLAHGVPYAIYGGTRFFERMEVKNALAYMRLTVNLQDDGSFRRVINVPARGLGDVAIEQIAKIAREHDVPMLQAAATQTEGKLRAKVDGFVGMLVDFFEQINSRPLPQFVQYVIEKSGLVDFYSKKTEDQERLENLKEMVSAATRFCEESSTPNALSRPAIEMIDEFLAGAALEAGVDSSKGNEHAPNAQEGQPAPTVTLMTVHASKGLEFDNVFVVGVDDTIFPVKKALDEGNESEERRLMYVAITRARQEIFFTHCSTRMVHGEIKELGASMFIDDIPSDLRNQENLVRSTNTFQPRSSKPASPGFNGWKSRP